MEEEYIDFFVLFLIVAFFFCAGLRMKNNPDKQVDRIVKMINSNHTYKLFTRVKTATLDPEQLINSEYRKHESN